jgi:hypothetical protein
MKIRMCVDVLAYRSHKPYVQLSMRDKWYDDMGPSKQQKDIVVKASIADTGAQCFLLGSKHLHGLGLDVSSLLQSEINLNCANSTAAGHLGVLETLGCIPKTFPQVGEFLTDDDAALTGRAFAVNPDRADV